MEALVIMANTIGVDLAALKRILHDGLSLSPHSLQGCVPEVGITSEDLAALLARDFSVIDGIIGPSELCLTGLTAK
jgi:hypothetical protein